MRRGRVVALTAALAMWVGVGVPPRSQFAASDPSSPMERGLALYESGRMAEALMAFHGAADADADSPMPDFGVGIVCAALGWLDRAEDALEDALTKRPGFPEAHDELGDILVWRLGLS